MRKVFVILLTICLCLLTGCKPALPGATIYIDDNTKMNPDSFELNVYFSTNRTPNSRAFHMKNIPSSVAHNSKAISLENVPHSNYVVEVDAYRNGEKVGYGVGFLTPGVTTVRVPVGYWEKPNAKYSKSFSFPEGSVDSVELLITDQKGNRISENVYGNLSSKSALVVSDEKINIEDLPALFTWTLRKSTSVIAVYEDRIEKAETSDKISFNNETLSLGFKTENITESVHEFNKLVLSVTPEDELREKIAGFKFEVGTRTEYRDLNSENIYTIDNLETGSYKVTVTPILAEGNIEMTSIKQTFSDVSTNIPLETVTFEETLTTETYKLELGLEPLTFSISRNPENYTRWVSNGAIHSSDLGIVEASITDDIVTITPIELGKTALTYVEEYQKVTSDTLNVQVILHEPKMNIKALGSVISVSWDFVYDSPKTTLKLCHQEKDSVDIVRELITDLHNPHETSQNKSTTRTYWLELTYDETTIRSNTYTYTTGKDSFVNITLPKANEFDIQFENDLDLDTVLAANQVVYLEAIRNPDIKNVFWMIDGKIVSTEDTFAYSALDTEYGIKPNQAITPIEILLGVETTDNVLYSKTIRLIFNMESQI